MAVFMWTHITVVFNAFKITFTVRLITGIIEYVTRFSWVCWIGEVTLARHDLHIIWTVLDLIFC